MRLPLAFAVLIALCASANAATVHRARTRHHVVAGPVVHMGSFAIPRAAYAAVPPPGYHDDVPGYGYGYSYGGGVPGYGDPSQWGGQPQ